MIKAPHDYTKLHALTEDFADVGVVHVGTGLEDLADVRVVHTINRD